MMLDDPNNCVNWEDADVNWESADYNWNEMCFLVEMLASNANLGGRFITINKDIL